MRCLRLTTDVPQIVDNTKAMSDKLLVRNSEAMQAIMLATQAEAESSRQIAVQSQRLSEEMMKDSVAMKTVSDAGSVILTEANLSCRSLS